MQPGSARVGSAIEINACINWLLAIWLGVKLHDGVHAQRFGTET